MSRRVALFLTCSADLLYPSAARATVRVLEALGTSVSFPAAQTCCGQAWLNAGQRQEARTAALHFLRVFEEAPAVVAPSASCVDTVRNRYPSLFVTEPALQGRFTALGARTYEVCEYLHREQKLASVPRLPAPVCTTYHASCRTLRGLGLRGVPEGWLDGMLGDAFHPLPETQREVCCGFGGTFSVKLPEISGRLLANKLAAVASTEAELVTSLDLGCLTHLAGGARRQGLRLRFSHVVELLAEALSGEPA
jgi:L-lactate dehydrogenase complex protein LldE